MGQKSIMFKLYQDGFIGDEHSRTEIEWRGGRDIESNFELNAKKYDLSYYTRKPLTYSFNQYGHRCRDIGDVDLDNYILFIGCSHTEGVGNFIDDTYPYIVSNSLQMDYYSLGLSGSGIDVQLHNLFTWTLRVKKPPKLLVWQWTLEPRVSIMNDIGELHCIGSWSDDRHNLDFLMAADKINFSKTKREFAKSVISNLSFPVVQVDIFKNDDVLYYQRHDFARDLMHYGPKSNQVISSQLINHINNKYSIG